MKLIILGAGGFLPTDAAQTACYFIPDAGILLDAGHGLYRLAGCLQSDSLDVYLSHAHADHNSGLDYLFASYLKREAALGAEPLSERNISGFVQRANEALKKTTIHASPETLAYVQPRYKDYPYQWRPLAGTEPVAGGGVLTPFALDPDTTGFRLEWPGHSLAYVTDTVARPDAPYLPHITGVDLLLHDCYGPDHLSGLLDQIGHSHPSTVARVAAAAQVKRVLLIHRSPFPDLDYSSDLPSARQIFPNILVGEDSLEVEY